MGFLEWFFGIFIKQAISYLVEYLEKLYRVFKKDQANHNEAVAEAEKDNEKASEINEGSTSDEVDQAVDDSLKHL